MIKKKLMFIIILIWSMTLLAACGGIEKKYYTSIREKMYFIIMINVELGIFTGNVVDKPWKVDD